jgi:hypothetical protein
MPPPPPAGGESGNALSKLKDALRPWGYRRAGRRATAPLFSEAASRMGIVALGTQVPEFEATLSRHQRGLQKRWYPMG